MQGKTNPPLTLHRGENRQEYQEHPTEIARKALLAAAEVEAPDWQLTMLRLANILPARAPLRKRGD